MSKNLTDLTFLACTLYKRCKEFNFSLIFWIFVVRILKFHFGKFRDFSWSKRGSTSKQNLTEVLEFSVLTSALCGFQLTQLVKFFMIV